jgi:hypothetical protein
MMHRGLLLILIRKCVFLLTTFVLRSVWMNWHNLRQVCNLEELTNQSKLTCGLASTQWTRSQVETC